MTDDALQREIRALRLQMHDLHTHIRSQGRSQLRHGWLSVVIHDLEYNPHTQYTVHLYAAIFWIVNAVAATFMLVVFPEQWAAIAVFYVAIVSLYANFATDYGAMSAAIAAQGQPPLPEIPLEVTRATEQEQK